MRRYRRSDSTRSVAAGQSDIFGRDHDGFLFSLPLAGFKKLSPVASFFLLLRQKKETKEKATPDRSTALALNSFSWSEGQGVARVKPAIKSMV